MTIYAQIQSNTSLHVTFSFTMHGSCAIKAISTSPKNLGWCQKNIGWPNWIEFMEDFLDEINLETLSDVNRRYEYEELRLSRLNTIYRFIPPAYSLKNFIGGYRSGSTWYNAFLERHLKWMLAVFAILSVFLSALQVGLATTMLQGNEPFQEVSHGFAIASLIAVVASVILVFFVWLGLFWYYLLSTWRNDKAVDAGDVPACCLHKGACTCVCELRKR